MSRYLHDDFSSLHDLRPGAIYAIAQSADGYLWIGAEKGLVRFDGLNFRVFRHADTPAIPPGPVLGVVADAEGNLWIRSQGPSLVRYRDGKFQSLKVVPGEADYNITAMGRGWNAELLLTYPNTVVRYSVGKFGPLLSGTYRPVVISMAETAIGKVWLGTRDSGLLSLSAGHLAEAGAAMRDSKINCLLAASDRQLWAGTDDGVLRWDGTNLTRSGVPDSLAHVRTLAFVQDRESNIWVGTASGLARMNAAGVAWMERSGEADAGVTALFDDREGDLWVGSEGGLERVRDSVFATYPNVGNGKAEGGGPLYVGSDGRTWFGSPDGGLSSIRGGNVERLAVPELGNDVVYSIDGDPDELWIARQRGGLTSLGFRDGEWTAKTYTHADGLAQNSVYAIYRSRDGSVWAGTVNGGVSRLANGHFTTYTTSDGLASNTVSAISEGTDGSMWFATPNGLSKLSNGQWTTLSGAEGLPPANLNCLFVDSAGVLWIGTSKGLVFLRSGRVEFPGAPREPFEEEIFGIAEDRSGWLWIATSSHILRVKRERLLGGAASDTDVREFGTADGLAGTEGVRRYRSVIADSQGRIWLSVNRGISVVDPARLIQTSAPVLVHLEKVSADGSQVDSHGLFRIPSSRRRITIAFAGLSLSVPQRVRYRYRLDPYDHDWSAPTASREADYTNLEPRVYRFRVIASSSEGVWNGAEAEAAIEIEPAVWQTWWFRSLFVLATIFCILMLYRYRLQQIAGRLSIRFEERLAERTRIAQELHDTLLQGFLSASMQLNVAVDRLPPDSPVRPSLTRVVQLMGQVIEEGRNAVRGLRSADSGDTDLEKAFSAIHREHAAKETAFRVVVEGHPRRLHPVLRDEVYRISREALVNAFRHSKARNVEVELEYTADRLRVLVRDDGVGIDPKVLTSGREGHWGLVGMRERAEQIGARLSLWSRATAGTEVELSVPGNIAFQAASSDGHRRWFAWLQRAVRKPGPDGPE